MLVYRQILGIPFYCTFLLLLSSLSPIKGGAQLAVLEKADSLLQAADTSAYFHEMERYVYLIGESKESSHIRFQLGEMYETNGKLDLAILNYEEAIGFLGYDWTYFSALNRYAFCKFLQSDFESCQEKAGITFRQSPFLDLKEEAAVLSIFSLNHLGRWQEAKVISAARFSKDKSFHNRLDSLYSVAANMKLKNPRTAKILSRIFPGVGLAYAGKPGRAIVSAGLTLSLAALTVYGLASERYVLAIFTGLPWFEKFYGGGSRFAEASTINENDKRILHRAQLINQVIGQHLLKLD